MSTSNNHFWFKLESNKWLIEQGLRSCSIAARGLWIDMLALMHQTTQAEDRGYLMMRDGGIPRPYPLAKVAHWAGIAENECQFLMEELERYGVYQVDERGIIYCAWMVDKDTLSRRRASGGVLGGNPKLKPKSEPMQSTLGFDAPTGFDDSNVGAIQSDRPTGMVNHNKEKEKEVSVYASATHPLSHSSSQTLFGNNEASAAIVGPSSCVVQTKDGLNFDLPEIRYLDSTGQVLTRRFQSNEFYNWERVYWDVNVPQELRNYAYWTKGASASMLHTRVDLGVKNWFKKVRQKSDELKRETREVMDQRASWPVQFRTLWEMYPRRENVVRALRLWQSLYPTGHTVEFEAILNGLKAWIAAPQWQNARFVPTFDKFIDERRWAETPAALYVVESGEKSTPRTVPAKPQQQSNSVRPREQAIGGNRTKQDLLASVLEDAGGWV